MFSLAKESESFIDLVNTVLPMALLSKQGKHSTDGKGHINSVIALSNDECKQIVKPACIMEAFAYFLSKRKTQL